MPRRGEPLTGMPCGPQYESVRCIVMGAWVLPSSPEFASWITRALGSTKVSKLGDKLDQWRHQAIVRDFIQYDSPYRGLLLFHGLGQGKSCAAVVAAEALMAHGMDVIVLLPASIEHNFTSEVRKCGGDALRATEWRWVALDAPDFQEVMTALKVSPKLAKRHKGVWAPSEGGAAMLSDAQRRQVAVQVEDMARRRFEYMHYNGVTLVQLETSKNPFDNKVVVIDEVHNLVSLAVGASQRGKRLYELLVTARGCKVIALSGTPLINVPCELAYLVGLLKGYQRIHELAFRGAPDAAVEVLERDPEVDTVEVEPYKSLLRYTRLPTGFRWTNGKREGVHRQVAARSEAPFEQRLISALKRAGVSAERNSGGTSYMMPLPLDEAKFGELFVDEAAGALRHPRTLKTRMLGCVSYFNSYSSELYPRRNPRHVERIGMSDEQFVVYEEVRHTERRMEEMSKKHAAARGRGTGGDESVFRDNSSYRPFSRAACNFVFPKGYKRPFPSNARQMADEVEQDAEESRAHAKKRAKDRYDATIIALMDRMRRDGGRVLRGEALARSSPKFARLLETVRTSPGPVLVYSEFRTVEGLGLLSVTLDANGWAEFALDRDDANEFVVLTRPQDTGKPKYIKFTGDKERTQVLLNAFNGNFDALPRKVRAALGGAKDNLHGGCIKMLMITRSGAEGISLQNVRQVHVLEPYWNQNRVDQVIGRAVRAGSHATLPSNERQVDVYEYIMVFTAAQLEQSFTLRTKDRSRTTDEHILDIANRKARLMSLLLDAMRSAAFDCTLHADKHPGVKCHVGEERPALEVDTNARRETARRGEGGVVPAQEVEFQGRRYAHVARVLYDLASYKKGALVRVGRVDASGRVTLV